MDALELLTDQHDEIERLIERLHDDHLPEARRMYVFFELADKLAAHVAMEETLFYPAAHARGIDVAGEHLAIKRVLADMLGTDFDDPRFEARLDIVEEAVIHHAREQEDTELFPEVRRAMSADERVVLGAEMLALYEQLLTRPPHDQAPIEEPARL